MRQPLQDFGDSQYDRPHLPWICGLADEGHACPAGPTAAGPCPAMAQCNPVRVGDRWQCNRSPLRGGPCASGPTPDGACSCVDRCQPVRNLRSRRGRMVGATAMFTASALLMLLSGPWRADSLKPGPLAQNHAQILADRADSQRCATCHEAAGGGFGTWWSAAVWHGDNMPTQSQLCLDCHDKTFAAELALVAHNVPPAELHEKTEARGGNSIRLADVVFGSPTSGRGEIACAQCHREHQGAMHDLTAMDDNACQACHVERYRSFAADHPDFSLWPYKRRTRIVFDHAAHQGKHFPEQNATFDCARCHLDDSTQNVKLLAGFEQSCARCHNEPIATSIGAGVPIFALPTIDAESLTAAGVTVGDWPEMATGEFDGRLPPVMKLLLAADPTVVEAMRQLGADFEFADVDPDDPEQVRAASHVIAATKRLLGQLAQSGRTVAKTRLAAAFGQSARSADVDLLLAGLSVDTIRAAQETWLPGMQTNTPTPDSENPNAEIPKSEFQVPNSNLSFSPTGTWHRDDTTFTLRYRPAGHADPLLSSWLNQVAAAASNGDNDLLNTVLKELSQPTTAGQCITCHSIERTDSGQLAVNWRALDPRDELRGFTKFTHRPHLIQPQLTDCTHCHQVDTNSDSSASYATHDPHSFVSDFLPLSKSQCAECHTPQAAGDRCQSCHNYHVDATGQ